MSKKGVKQYLRIFWIGIKLEMEFVFWKALKIPYVIR